MNTRVHSFAVFTAVATFFLLVAGALVTTTGSGLSVPDWPLSFGQFFPPMKGGVFFEHGHRLVAGLVATLMTVLALVLWTQEKRRWVKWLGGIALGAVLLQALLGGLTVLYGLPIEVSVAHAVLAQTFFCLTVCLALFTSPYWTLDRQDLTETAEKSILSDSGKKFFFVFAAGTTLLVYLQLILGASLRHGGGILFLRLHLVGAFFTSLAVIILSRLAMKWWKGQPGFSFLGHLLLALVLIQLCLGLVSLLPILGFAVYVSGTVRMAIVTAHVALGALLLAASLVMVLWSARLSFLSQEPFDLSEISV